MFSFYLLFICFTTTNVYLQIDYEFETTNGHHTKNGHHTRQTATTTGRQRQRRQWGEGGGLETQHLEPQVFFFFLVCFLLSYFFL
jgi:hypothetical protein